MAPTALVPGLAVATYAALVPFATTAPGTGPFYVLIVAMIAVLSLAGTVALVWSLWRTWRRPAAVDDVSGPRAAAAR